VGKEEGDEREHGPADGAVEENAKYHGKSFHPVSWTSPGDDAGHRVAPVEPPGSRQGQPGQFRARGDTGLGEDVAQVELDGPRADEGRPGRSGTGRCRGPCRPRRRRPATRGPAGRAAGRGGAARDGAAAGARRRPAATPTPRPDAEDLHVCAVFEGPVGGVGEQRRLADAGQSPDHESATAARARLGDQRGERCTLRVAPVQHPTSLRGSIRR
jgi:hypothetical protein